MIFFFKQKTAYEMRISDWSSDVCSSDLIREPAAHQPRVPASDGRCGGPDHRCLLLVRVQQPVELQSPVPEAERHTAVPFPDARGGEFRFRSEEHTSELQSLMRISYAVFCLKKKNTKI